LDKKVRREKRKYNNNNKLANQQLRPAKSAVLNWG
jgi:hypothetical protein